HALFDRNWKGLGIDLSPVSLPHAVRMFSCVGCFWVLLSSALVAICSFSFISPAWVVKDHLKNKDSVSFGLLWHCSESLDHMYKCYTFGGLGKFQEIPSSSWQRDLNGGLERCFAHSQGFAEKERDGFEKDVWQSFDIILIISLDPDLYRRESYRFKMKRGAMAEPLVSRGGRRRTKKRLPNHCPRCEVMCPFSVNVFCIPLRSPVQTEQENGRHCTGKLLNVCRSLTKTCQHLLAASERDSKNHLTPKIPNKTHGRFVHAVRTIYSVTTSAVLCSGGCALLAVSSLLAIITIFLPGGACERRICTLAGYMQMAAGHRFMDACASYVGLAFIQQATAPINNTILRILLILARKLQQALMPKAS
ncbi:putative transmembrane protein 211, partial [Triplophysa rosa]